MHNKCKGKKYFAEIKRYFSLIVMSQYFYIVIAVYVRGWQGVLADTINFLEIAWTVDLVILAIIIIIEIWILFHHIMINESCI